MLKLDPNQPSWTIIASPGHWEGPFHWTNRRLNIRELAAIQTFPDDYVFEGSKESVRKQIGMAVPCQGAKIIFEAILKTFAGIEYESMESSLKDEVDYD